MAGFGGFAASPLVSLTSARYTRGCTYNIHLSAPAAVPIFW